MSWSDTEWGSTALDALADDPHVEIRWSFWATVKNRSTGASVDLGYWTGEYDTTITSGTARSFTGMAGGLEFPEIEASIGTEINDLGIGISHASDELIELALTYDPHMAPAEVHAILFDADMVLIDVRRFWKGRVNSIKIPTPVLGAGGMAEIKLLSTARDGTRAQAAKKSNEQQSQRASDAFRKYGSATGNDYIGKRG